MRTTKVGPLLLLPLLLSLMAACGEMEPEEVTVDVDTGTQLNLEPAFSSIYNGFAQSCAFSSCHGEPNPMQGLSFDEDQESVHAHLLGPSNQQPEYNLVEPGNSDGSWLVMKLEGTATVGDRMPQGNPLSQADIDAVRDWISAGAALD